jgi:TPR repeat protein
LTTAVKWWRKAAKAGEKGSLWYMELCYYYGRGVNRDVPQAMDWFRKAAAQGWQWLSRLHSRVWDGVIYFGK